MKTATLIYLAAPYTHPDKAVIEERVKLFSAKDSELSAGNVFTVSPLFKHLLFVNGSKLPSDWAYWENYSYTLLQRCDRLVVLKMPGWEESVGVSAEIKYAFANDIDIIYIDPLDNAYESYIEQVSKFIQ